MGIAKLLFLPFRYKPWMPRNMRMIASDIFIPASQREFDHKTHLQAAIDWLCYAQDQRMDKLDAGGVSAGWNYEDGWLPSYPETTGYIIETFLASAKVLGRSDLVDRGIKMIEWELSLQHDDGAFPGHFGEVGNHPVIFNTGQIMHGLLAGFSQLDRQDCLDAAVRAGHWLASHQDEDGCWRKFEHNGVPHVYNTRCSWALLSTGMISGDKRLIDSATKNLDWALTQQTPSGWYATNAFTPDRDPFTHTIAYAIRGFLESGVLLNEVKYVNSALLAARGVASALRDDGWLAGTFADKWKPTASYCCLTGVAQMCLNWIRLAQDCGASELEETAERGICFLKKNQRIDTNDRIVKGAIAGSLPIWGDYSRFEYPNWATKFFVDALIMEMSDMTIPPISTRYLAEDSGRAHG